MRTAQNYNKGTVRDLIPCLVSTVPEGSDDRRDKELYSSFSFDSSRGLMQKPTKQITHSPRK